MLDRDLVTAGALLHDIGKVQELAWDGGSTRYTDEGRLVGHIVMTAQAIREKAARIPGFPPLLEAPHHPRRPRPPRAARVRLAQAAR